MRNIGVACILACGLAAYAYAQTPPALQANAECKDKNWSRLSVTARIDQGGVTPDGTAHNALFCVGGALIKTDELRVVSTDGQRTYSLSGNVTLTMPAR